jgi:ribonuclease HI
MEALGNSAKNANLENFMGNKKKQYYVVVKGHKPGIYSNWSGEGEAAEQVQGFSGAVYKGFYTYEEAMNWLREFPPETVLEFAPNFDEEVESLPALSETIAELLKSEKVVMFTDGGANTNSGAGGYGVVLRYKESVKELSGGFRKTTNNRMEITACIEGLRALKKRADVAIFSDSQYVVNGISKGWAKKWQAQNWMRNDKERAENPDLWAQLLDLCSQHDVEFFWVKGHNGTRENERCDKLAMKAAQKANLPADEGFENPKPVNSVSLFSAISLSELQGGGVA